ncbi:MAG: hypothetical protein ABI744_04690 [Chloroflexota bacterium]
MRLKSVVLAIGLVWLVVGCLDRPASNAVVLRFPVTNDSPVAAALKVVNEASGVIVGSATPALIAPGARTQVVVEVPIGLRGWAIYVDAGNGQGMLVFDGNDLLGCSGDVPIEIFVTRAGQPSWQAPIGNWCGRH